ncbi:UNVERIFIED_CONTAM: hypothetical protein FKN15_061784 [Acipenser sinensis]
MFLRKGVILPECVSCHFNLHFPYRATATKCVETKECSAYEVICTNADYEVRHYNASKWVSTSVQSYFMEMAAYDGFRKLFKYIKGANADGKCQSETEGQCGHGASFCFVSLSFMQVRHYNASKWVSTSVQSYFMEMAAYDGFRKLFKYIKGANADGVHIDMTSPVLIKKPEARNMWEPVTYTISFLLPAAYQDAAPAPTNGDVHFLKMPEMHAYVKSFGGWMLSVNTKLYSILLSRELNAASASYNTTFYYGAGYNSPRTVFNRHNEVWYIAEGKPKCSGQQT